MSRFSHAPPCRRSFLCLLPVAWLLFSTPLSAQCPVDQTFSTVMFIAGTDTVRGNQLFPYWRFAMTYDSAQVQYEITEFERNHSRILLGNWCSGKTIEGEAAELADSTFTGAFTVYAGDSLSFYRQLLWTAPYDGGPSNGLYYALDTLDFVVELIDASTGLRLAVLDSIGALREVPSGYPDFYGTHPVMAVVNYRVPAGLNGKTVYLRVHPYMRGNGQYLALRVDNFSTRRSVNLTEQFFIDYVNMYGGGSKTPVRYLENVANVSNALHGAAVPGVGRIDAVYDGISTIEGDVKLALCNERGEQVFLFAGLHRADQPFRASYDVAESGVYFIVLSHGGSPVSAVKVIASR